MKICHMTSAHKSLDERIFYKECCSLARRGYETYIVAPGESLEKNGVKICGIGDTSTNRLNRMFSTTKRVYNRAIQLDADIYHFHDPELLPYGLRLKRKGKKVIFDSHEDYPLLMLNKEWLPVFLRKVVSKTYLKYELHVCKQLDAVVACYHWTKERLIKVCNIVDLVFNFPILSNEEIQVDYSSRNIVFAGNISEQWRHKNIIKALDNIDDVTYILAGDIDEQYKCELESLKSWKKVDYLGSIPHDVIDQNVYARAAVGMAILDYIPQCKYTEGNLSNTKFFEYMKMGLPLICTDFVLWKEIVDEYNCGICVNPNHVDEIYSAISELLNDIRKMQEMGKNGKRAIKEKYNWHTEEDKLFKLYDEVGGCYEFN